MSSTRPQRILLVEDEVLIRAVVAEYLREAGLVVVEAGNADEAWYFLQSGSVVNLVFTDVQMPGTMTGLELARRINASHPSLPVIVTSGNLGPEHASYVGEFVAKPYAVDQIVSFILDVLARSRQMEDHEDSNGIAC